MRKGKVYLLCAALAFLFGNLYGRKTADKAPEGMQLVKTVSNTGEESGIDADESSDEGELQLIKTVSSTSSAEDE